MQKAKQTVEEWLKENQPKKIPTGEATIKKDPKAKASFNMWAKTKKSYEKETK